jgi:hypothetical protein
LNALSKPFNGPRNGKNCFQVFFTPVAVAKLVVSYRKAAAIATAASGM